MQKLHEYIQPERVSFIYIYTYICTHMTVTDTDRSSKLCPLFFYFLAMQGNVFQTPQANVWFAHTLVTLNTHGEMQSPMKACMRATCHMIYTGHNELVSLL